MQGLATQLLTIEMDFLDEGKTFKAIDKDVVQKNHPSKMGVLGYAAHQKKRNCFN